MARYKRFLDIDVLTAARQRVAHLYDLFDTVAVCFSGGKDSLAVLHLVREEAERRGALPVDVLFRDEELIPDTVINFVDSYRREPWVRMRWYCVPLASKRYVLGQNYNYVQWDKDRPHVRPKPEWAITLPDGEYRVMDQWSMDEFAARPYKGKVAFCTGVRAAESLIRYRSCVNKLNENYINGTDCPRVSLCKPIYDWQEDDVFRFFYDKGVQYCPVYDQQIWAGEALRVATPFHAEAAKRLDLLKQRDPVFYDRCTRLFPQMRVQERYWREFDWGAVLARYGSDYEAVGRYIAERIEDPDQRAKAQAAYASVVGRARKMPASYPPEHVLKYIVGGSYHRECLPVGRAAGDETDDA